MLHIRLTQIIFNAKLLHLLEPCVWGRGGCVCVCYVRHLLPIIICRLTEPCRAEEETKSNQCKCVSSAFFFWRPHVGSPHTRVPSHKHTLSYCPASSRLLSFGGVCQHQCVRGESHPSLTSPVDPTPPGKRTTAWVCVRERNVCIRACNNV